VTASRVTTQAGRPGLTPEQALNLLRIVRFAIGGVGWAAPVTSARLMALDAPSSVNESYLMRLFAVRDALMGVLLLVPDEDERRRHLSIGVAVDLADVVAGAAGAATGRARPAGAVFPCVAGLCGASLGAAAIGRGPLARRTVH